MSEPSPEKRKCAVCGKLQDSGYRPFCSKRCADIDLGRWLNENYSVPGGEPPQDSGEEPE